MKFVRICMNFFARKIGYVTNGLYCRSKIKGLKEMPDLNSYDL